MGGGSQGDDAFSSPLTKHPQQLTIKINVINLEIDKFPDT
jgi:hypothetical protein